MDIGTNLFHPRGAFGGDPHRSLLLAGNNHSPDASHTVGNYDIEKLNSHTGI